MPSISFPSVTVEAANGGKPCTITSVEQAADFLINNWQPDPGRLHSLARQACIDALEGNLSGAEARAVFIDAAREADILMDYGAVTSLKCPGRKCRSSGTAACDSAYLPWLGS
jgi:hypothetical protein